MARSRLRQSIQFQSRPCKLEATGTVTVELPVGAQTELSAIHDEATKKNVQYTGQLATTNSHPRGKSLTRGGPNLIPKPQQINNETRSGARYVLAPKPKQDCQTVAMGPRKELEPTDQNEAIVSRLSWPLTNIETERERERQRQTPCSVDL